MWCCKCAFSFLGCVLVFVVTNIPGASGDCIYSEALFKNGSVWHSEPCTSCRCVDPVAVCEPVVCPDPTCHFQQGEQLYIPAGQCCPLCAGQRSPCHYKGQTVPHNTEWSPALCEQCHCNDGRVTCSNITCQETRCKPGQVRKSMTDQCCPVCLPTGRSCEWEGASYHDGDDWQPLPCTRCMCRDGQTNCYPVQCPPLNCPMGLRLVRDPESCCPVCAGDPCVDQSITYKDGSQWYREPCTACLCVSGEVVCGLTPCPLLTCAQNEIKVRRPGKCCEECIPDEETCEDEESVHYSGDMWNVSSCDFCGCHQGKVSCHTATCDHVQCNKGERLAKSPGKCCPTCEPQIQCEFGGVFYTTGDTWYPDACMVCVCESGRTECYQRQCLVCPEGSVMVRQPGECCGQCKKVVCGADCAECQPGDPDSCTKCRDEGRLLQAGNCVVTCFDGFYAASDHLCQACERSCKLCSGGSRYHCVECQPGLLFEEGQCLTLCSPGHFLQNAHCYACDASCLSCAGPSSDQCLSCRHPGHVVTRGRCVEHCPINTYISNNKCEGCPGECDGCLPDAPRCQSCPQGAVLYKGRCPSSCPVGFYPDQTNVCRVCHPSCDGCSGGGDSDCTSCHGGARLQGNKCRMPCPPGQYLRMDGNCRRCVPGCRHCHVTADGSQTRCMMCSEGEQVPVGAVCQDDCGPGRYLDNGICQDCEMGCAICDGPAVCRSCEHPFVLHNHHCVKSCARGQYAKGSICQDCPESCVRCNSSSTCQVCADGTYLKEGQCAADCGLGYLTQNYRCVLNRYAPVFQVLGAVKVTGLGESTLLSQDLFLIEDVDTARDELTFRVIEMPYNGQLVKTERGRDITLEEDGTFSLKDLSEGRVRFTQDGSRSLQGGAQLLVSDGQLVSEPQTLTIMVQSDHPLTVLGKGSFMAESEADTELDSSLIDVRGDTRIQPVVVSLLQGPQNGKLIHKIHDGVVTQFPLDEIRSGNILYRHDDSSSSHSDIMVFQVTDGYNVVNRIIKAEIRDKDSHIPLLVKNEGVSVTEGGMVQITSDTLQARGVDSDAELVFSLVPPSPSNPLQGEILMVLAVPPEGLLLAGWQRLDGGLMAKPVYHFRQRDVDEGRIWYRHSVTKAPADAFSFSVSNKADPPNVLTGQFFDIAILPSPTAALNPPTPPPGSFLTMTVPEGETAVIPTTVLSYSGTVSDPANLVYRITKALSRGDGVLEHTDVDKTDSDKQGGALYRFTQEDIDNGKIVYSPHTKENWKPKKKVKFSFVATNEETGVRNPEQTFVIVIEAKSKPPKFRNSSPLLLVPAGGYVPLGGEVLQLSEDDNDEDSLSVSILTLPSVGTIVRGADGMKHPLSKGDEISYSEVVRSGLYYQHDGSDGLKDDSFVVSVSDGVHSVQSTVSVAVLHVEKSAPSLSSSASLQLHITEGKRVTVSKKHLSFTDKEDGPKRLRIILSTDPLYGSLHVKGRRGKLRVGSAFTQHSVNKGHVSYKADKEIGARPVSDSLMFNVLDNEDNVLPNQVLLVTVTPKNDQAPVVFGKLNVQVDEGGEYKLTSADLSVSDPDTDPGQLSVMLDVTPKFGALVNQKPVLGSEQLVQNVVNSFSVKDLLAGHIVYVQREHSDVEPTSDHFIFHASDTINKSPRHRLNISIIPQNDEIPQIVTEQLLVQEDKSVTMTNTSFFVVDLDTPPTDLVFTLDSPPHHGSLGMKEQPGDFALSAATVWKGGKFSYQESDILDGLIVYNHGGEEVTTDSFSLSLTDGQFSVTKTISVVIGLVNDETPRLVVNHGLRLPAGSTLAIKPVELRATDIDSDDDQIIYKLTSDPSVGTLRLNKAGRTSDLSATGFQDVFTQADIDKGYVEYAHEKGDVAGPVVFSFQLSDPEGNTLLAQTFHITVLEDRILPVVDTNRPLTLSEGSQAKITTQYLSASDKDSEPGNLLFSVLSNPLYGHLELSSGPGVPVSEFLQSDLAANSLIYVHDSDEEVYADRFKFSVSDRTNEVSQSFHIIITPVDDSVPMVSVNGLRVQEGVRKVISEFDLKAIDKDTKEDHIIFSVVRPPRHGSIELERGKFFSPATRFSMADIYENRVSYKHDGSETLADNFSFTVSDGTNHMFVMQRDSRRRGDITVPMITKPQDFKIDVMPLDDGSPILETNLGLQFLKSSGEEIFNLISERELKVSDVDTPPDKILFVVTSPPEHGRLVNWTDRAKPIRLFTQDDISKGLVGYILSSPSNITMDSFSFEVMDSKPNIIPDNTFHVSWSVIEFDQPYINITETGGVIQVPVVRRGNLKQYSIITCRTLPGTATSTRVGNKPGLYDYVEHSGQVQFDEWQDRKPCTVIVNDDSVFEGPETLYLELSDPNYTLLGPVAKMAITIFDLEDEPVIQFEKGLYQVNESDGYVLATLTREGDLSSSVSVICYTQSLTATGSSLGGLESGSDFQSRGKTNSYRVVFPPGVVTASCEVKLIDDSEFETGEEFELGLINPSLPAAIGPMSRATVIIEGPNDESVVFLSQAEYHVPEDGGLLEIEVFREGSDLAHSTMVWCATRLSDTPSATPGQDYVPSSSQITFGPGQLTETCQLTILDDNVDPRMEGNETFVVFLSSPMGSSLADPFTAAVHIHDSHLDIPVMEFEGDRYYVDEKNGSLGVPVVRRGDLSYQSSVLCFTRQDTAAVMMDFEERFANEASRITFYPGQMVKNCTVEIVDDGAFEPEETLTLNLADPQGTELSQANIGPRNTTTIVITNYHDVPTIQLEKPAYSVMEPSAEEVFSTVIVMVIRSGDINQTSSVRCSTRDGSASSGVDYNPKSLQLTFEPGVTELEFPVEVLYNSEIEWHESLSVLLGPDDPEGAVLGPVRTATITILDNEVSGSLVLPAAPIVVSLLHYDDVKKGASLQPSPGYPLVCVTPCDLHYPDYASTHSLCEDAGVNQTNMYYRWEVSMPDGHDGSLPPFVTVSDSTLFSSVNRLVLDSIYFRPSFKVRCVAQPLHQNGNPGVPLRSNTITVGRDNALCPSTVFSGKPYGYQAQSFIARLDYVSPEDEVHPNTIHISVQVPHQDGMLPLVSTFPLHNLRFLLSDPTYRQQHVCSNIVTEKERAPLIDEGFLSSSKDFALTHGPGYNLPYQFDNLVREVPTLHLYKHLDLKSCLWRFDAWYHMTELVDVCGGKVMSDFQVRDSSKTYLTVRLPLYVSYLYATAPTGWGSLEHRTEMEVSFLYNTILWRTGLETDGKLGGKLQVLRILIGEDGKLIVDFKTQAKFRGLYVPSHHTLQGSTSRVLPPPDLDIGFDLELLWSQQTFDSPQQLWRATSDYNLKDYTGQYVIELIPCSVKSTQAFTGPQPTLPCTAHQPERFEVPIAFQQTNRPVPVVYSLDTEFQLTNNEKMFLLDLQETHLTLDDLDYSGAFSKGQKIFGRVLWSPEQDLKTAYRLVIEKIYLCTGRDGYVPTFDPTGEVYNEGPQFGCIQPHPKLKYRFLILDRENPDVAQTDFNSVDFGAQFAGENPAYAVLESMPGVDGFVMNVDPLYKVDSGHQWYLQCLYTIGVSDRGARLRRASVVGRFRRDFRAPDWFKNSEPKNGTNIHVVMLNETGFEFEKLLEDKNLAAIIAPAIAGAVVAAILLCCCCCLCCVRRRRRRKQRMCEEKKSNIEIAKENSRRIDRASWREKSKSRALSELDINNVTSSMKRRSSLKNVNVRVSLSSEADVKGPGTEV